MVIFAAPDTRKDPPVKPVKSFMVFGEPVDILVNSAMTGGQSCTLLQTSPPGGGPPPHSHVHERETFYVLEGEYEFLSDGAWHKVGPGDTVQGSPATVHTFRNAGTTEGKMLVFVTPGGFENYLEEISVLSVPRDVPQLLTISERYGVKFVL
jgi:quercetin dioxygenase-like cupin family protein